MAGRKEDQGSLDLWAASHLADPKTGCGRRGDCAFLLKKSEESELKEKNPTKSKVLRI